MRPYEASRFGSSAMFGDVFTGTLIRTRRRVWWECFDDVSPAKMFFANEKSSCYVFVELLFDNMLSGVV